MQVSIDSLFQTKAMVQTEDAAMKVEEAFRLAEKSALHYSELIRCLQRVPGVKSAGTAERLFRVTRNASLLQQNLLKQWELSKSPSTFKSPSAASDASQ